ncbi:pilus assembly protein [Hydrogenophaga intermedia]|uniref:pilus assembly protein n=1 Tax=Hydrogenophaga intermedia TaxID=65786 RepID=UPI00204479C7|nr:pilus assembly protein [Hydrogenophaga intermedia]MCM3564394.1 pilus assembly protein [Hydrogenophaga intermedia]
MSSTLSARLQAAAAAAGVHFGISIVVGLAAALLVWGVWYPHPFDQLSGGRELFLLVVAVDIVCGPFLTLVVYDRRKPRSELIRDLSLIGILQMGALGYGLWTVAEARPLYLVHEVERFRVIAKADYLGADVASAIDALPTEMQPSLLAGPILVGARPPLDPMVRNEVLMDALGGGRDFVQRPEYYVAYDADYGREATTRAKPLKLFADRFPDRLRELESILEKHGVPLEAALFLPVVHRQDWIVVMDGQGRLLEFVPGDGFSAR